MAVRVNVVDRAVPVAGVIDTLPDCGGLLIIKSARAVLVRPSGEVTVTWNWYSAPAVNAIRLAGLTIRFGAVMDVTRLRSLVSRVPCSTDQAYVYPEKR